MRVALDPDGRERDVLLAVNPYRERPDLYSSEKLQEYSSGISDAPHLFGMAARALRGLLSTGKSQSLLISGESGGGKTESTKLVMRFLAFSSEGNGHLEELIVQTNPALEAFGNARTLRNANSSRFGKWIAMGFSPKGKLTSSKIKTTLLEKVRCVHRSVEGERGFHVFYESLKDDLLQESVTSKGSSRRTEDSRNLELRTKALDAICEGVRDDVFRAVRGLAHLGCLDFVDDDDGAKLEDETHLSDAAEVFERAPDVLKSALLEKTNTHGLVLKNTVAAARRARDSCIKAAYAQLFDALVTKSNNLLMDDDESDDSPKISVLDIFGFEFYEGDIQNSLEQLLVNYANEKLQRHFVETVFEAEQLIYKEEGVDVDFHFHDVGKEKAATLLALDGAKHTVLPTLDEECILKSHQAAKRKSVVDDDEDLASALVRRLRQNVGKLATDRFSCDAVLERDGLFSVRHFAATVTYSAAEMVAKNMDSVPAEIIECFPLKVSAKLDPQCQLKLLAPPPTAPSASSSAQSATKKKKPLTPRRASQSVLKS